MLNLQVKMNTEIPSHKIIESYNTLCLKAPNQACNNNISKIFYQLPDPLERSGTEQLHQGFYTKSPFLQLFTACHFSHSQAGK